MHKPRRLLIALAPWWIVALLAGCATRTPERDGPGSNPPPNLARVPDAEPRVEPLRVGGPNKPYEVLGQRYVPMTSDQPLAESGGASWYGRKFHGRPTSSGEPYDMYAMTAAHKTMPIPSYAVVRNPANGREIVVRVNDRGPFSPGRVIDLSYTAALKLDLLRGVAPVQVRRLTHAEIRAGRGTAMPAIEPAERIEGPDLVAAAVLPPDDPAPGDAAGGAAGWWLQLGAFRSRDGAEQLQQRVLRAGDGLPGVAVFEEEGLYRVQAGPFAGRSEALGSAERLRAQWGVAPVLIERRHR